jgi:acetyl esterase/lipase
MRTYTYKKVGDLEIQANVHGAEEGFSKPTILWIHGGALIVGSRNGPRKDQLAAYLDAGYLLVSIDYRLAPETKIPGIVEDLSDAMTWIAEEGPDLFGADPERLAVIGHSAGGYLTLMAGFCSEVKPKALVPFYGYGDIVGDWYSKPDPFYRKQELVPEDRARSRVGTEEIANDIGTEKRGEFYLYCRQNGLWPKEVGGADPETDPEFFIPYSPVKNVDENYPPTLLLHGDNDTDVPYVQSVLFAETLKRNGVEYELITIEDGPHGFDGRNGGLADPENAKVFERVLTFLDKYLKG